MTTKPTTQPQATDVEAAILGACIQFERAQDEALELIPSARVFYEKRNRVIFEAIKSLADGSEPINLVTLSHRLQQQKNLEQAGGDAYLVQLIQKVHTAAHINYHAHILLQKYMLREFMRMGQDLISYAMDPEIDVFNLMDTAGQRLDLINQVTQRGLASKTWADAVQEIPKKVEQLSLNQGKITGLATGLDVLDRFFGGWQKSDLIIIGADSGMGKTAFAMASMLGAAKAGQAVGMVSMEMSTLQLAIRGVSVEGNFHMRRLTQRGLEKAEDYHKLQSVVNDLKDLPIYVDDRPSLTVPEMKRRARQMKRQHNIQLFIADFIQMFTGEEDDIRLTGKAARELKNLAKELDIPVIALSQLSREVKKVKYHIPSKHHLKNSSGVEEAADIIGLLYRPEYYGFTRAQNPDLYQEIGLGLQDNAVLIIDKNRNGGTSRLPLKYVDRLTKYANEDYQEPAELEADLKQMPY